ncbi:MAG: hypothetical protein HYR72_26970 [Deltaproteobacteria bacterium]|nr:hypothetical protein [Deltaproteobacteria bacterium]MBI3390343.1 hypothetical protein [Deltaproteobacteria bacterium]
MKDHWPLWLVIAIEAVAILALVWRLSIHTDTLRMLQDEINELRRVVVPPSGDAT